MFNTFQIAYVLEFAKMTKKVGRILHRFILQVQTQTRFPKNCRWNANVHLIRKSKLPINRACMKPDSFIVPIHRYA